MLSALPPSSQCRQVQESLSILSVDVDLFAEVANEDLPTYASYADGFGLRLRQGASSWGEFAQLWKVKAAPSSTGDRESPNSSTKASGRVSSEGCPAGVLRPFPCPPRVTARPFVQAPLQVAPGSPRGRPSDGASAGELCAEVSRPPSRRSNPAEDDEALRGTGLTSPPRARGRGEAPTSAVIPQPLAGDKRPAPPASATVPQPRVGDKPPAPPALATVPARPLLGFKPPAPPASATVPARPLLGFKPPAPPASARVPPALAAVPQPLAGGKRPAPPASAVVPAQPLPMAVHPSACFPFPVYSPVYASNMMVPQLGALQPFTPFAAAQPFAPCAAPQPYAPVSVAAPQPYAPASVAAPQPQQTVRRWHNHTL